MEMTSRRAVGQLPVSIATAMAIESLCGIGDDLVLSAPKVKHGEVLYINLRTLIRNAYGALDNADRPLATAENLHSIVADDIKNIVESFKQYLNFSMTVRVFFPSYKSVDAKCPRAIIRPMNTARQLVYVNLEMGAVTLLRKTLGDYLIECDTKIPESPVNAILLTNYPIDLLSRYRFNNLVLLESHTGAIKSSGEWYSKLYTKGLVQIPFNRITLQIFGDSVMFSPMPPAIKAKIIELANKFKWNATTTSARIIENVKSIHEPTLEVLVRDLNHE